jgi:hypothetical protein
MVGATGFEPATSTSRTWHATAALRPDTIKQNQTLRSRSLKKYIARINNAAIVTTNMDR